MLELRGLSHLGYTAIALEPTLVFTPEAYYYFHPGSCQLHNHLNSSSQLAWTWQEVVATLAV